MLDILNHYSNRSRAGRAIAIASLGTALLSACAGDADDLTRHSVTTDTVGGVERIVNRGGGMWSEAEAWQVDTDGLVIGALEGPEELTFGSVAGVVVGSDGRIYVADGQVPEARIFSPHGEFLTRIGRSGEGPGEFRAIDALVRGPAGEIVIRDPQLARVTVFTPGGVYLRSFMLRRPYLQYQDGSTFWVDQDGRAYDRMHLSFSIDADTVGVVSYTPSGELLDTAVVAGYSPPTIRITQGGNPRMGAPVLFAPYPSVAVSPDGEIVGGLGDSYELQVRDRSGELSRVVTRALEPQPLPPDARDSVDVLIARLLEMADGGEVSEFTLPGQLPAYIGVIIDDEGFWWVGRAPDFRRIPTRYDVFDPQGRYLGVVETPEVRILQIGPDFIAGRRLDESGVAYAVVLPLRRHGGAPGSGP